VTDPFFDRKDISTKKMDLAPSIAYEMENIAYFPLESKFEMKIEPRANGAKYRVNG
jgi:hypothetical protein